MSHAGSIYIPRKYASRSRRILASWLLYLAIPTIILLDITSFIYNNIVFRIAGIPVLERKKYIRPFSRFKIPNISIWQKIGCVYCSYANGVAYYFKDTTMSIEFLYCPWKQRDATKIFHHKFFRDW